MLFKIILLGTVFLVDNVFGSCGTCQTNHVACHSENTFSLCVEEKPTDSVVRCPMGRVCTDDPDICIEKDNALILSCVAEKLSVESGSFYETQDLLGSYSSTLTPDSTETPASDKETSMITDNFSATELDEGDTSPSTQYSDTTVDPTVAEFSDNVISTTPDELSTTDSQGGEMLSTTEDSNSSTERTVTDEEITSITEDFLSTTESPEHSSSSTQVTSSSDISTTDTIATTTSAPRDATTFCSETKDVGTFKAEGDTSCQRYYICTTFKDGFKGYEFKCDENSYFNSKIGLCQKDKPDDC